MKAIVLEVETPLATVKSNTKTNGHAAGMMEIVDILTLQITGGWTRCAKSFQGQRLYHMKQKTVVLSCRTQEHVSTHPTTNTNYLLALQGLAPRAQLCRAVVFRRFRKWILKIATGC